MENYENIFNCICRVCLTISKSENMKSLIDDSDPSALSCFGKAIPTFAQVSYKKSDTLPRNVCQKCVYLLKQAIYFKLTCESSEKWLREVLEKDMKAHTSEQKIKENICQYIMYRHYFPEEYESDSKEYWDSYFFPPKTLSDLKERESKLSKTCRKIEKTEHVKNESMSDDCDSDYGNNYLSEPASEKELSKPKSKIKKERKSKERNGLMKNAVKFETNKKQIKRNIRQPKPLRQRNIPCKICNKVLANRLTYDHHMQRHNICKYICDKCGKGFPIVTELHIHQISRHGVGPYLQCEQCSYKAPTKLKLKEHIRLHTGERPFTCDKCGLTFRRQAIWRNHQVHHSEKSVQCTYCPKKFYSNRQMLAHINSLHERRYVYLCSICNVTYAKSETVKRHMISKHGIPREFHGRIVRLDKGTDGFPEK